VTATDAVASPDRLASEAGVAMLEAGGTAADAAVAASAAIAVTSPHLCGMGGDLWALVHTGGEPEALDSSGWAGSGADAARLRDEGWEEMPFSGDVRAAPVPGCVDGWLALHARHGRLPFDAVLAPAIALAEEGFPCSPLLALLLPHFTAHVADEDDLLPATTPVARDVRVRRPALAKTLRAVATSGRAGFYEGTFGAALVAVGGGEYEPADLATPIARWVEPLGLDVWGRRVWTVPPGSQGYLTLAGLHLAERLDLPDDPDDGRWAHLLVEAARAAGHDRIDRLHEHADGAALLDPARLDGLLGAIRPDRRASWASATPAGSGDTIYLAAVDGDRRGVSLIQSNASGFGAGIAVPGTGVYLHNRGIGFSVVAGHPAEYGPRRRPPSTLAPALVTTPGGELAAVAGTMGGDSQPQILLQVLGRLLRHGQSAVDAVARPRWVLANPAPRGFDTWRAGDDVVVRVEADAPPDWAEALAAAGHVVQPAPALDLACGHAQAIVLAPDGTVEGAADPRARVGAAVSTATRASAGPSSG
jgi:gamma-glutamyltranspeptidase/glutathione hydrolase